MVKQFFLHLTVINDAVDTMREASSSFHHVNSYEPTQDHIDHMKMSQAAYNKANYTYNSSKGICDAYILEINKTNICASRILPQIPPKAFWN